MKLPKPPTNVLTDSFIYKEYRGETGDWNKAEYEDPVTVERCKIDRASAYAVSGKEKKEVYDAVIYCYPTVTTNEITFTKQSIVIFGEKEYKIVRVVEVREPFSAGIYCYEIEVI